MNYPGLKSFADHDLATKQFPRGAGGILTFDLANREQAYALQNQLQLIRRATNINDNKSLILHPASTIFCEFSAEEKLAMGVRDVTLRLSVGIEDVSDLQQDLERGLSAL